MNGYYLKLFILHIYDDLIDPKISDLLYIALNQRY